jgi:predicted nucleotidyltransferase
MSLTFGLKCETIEAINRVFGEFPKIRRAVIYGSRALGNYRNESDIDLTLVDENLDFQEFLLIESMLDELLLPWKIDLSQLRKITNPDLKDHIMRVGQNFYVREN